MYEWLGRAAGVQPRLVHVASERIARELPDLGPGILGDRSHAVLFDTTKLRRIVPEFTTTIPYAEGARRQIAWYDAHPEAQQLDEDLDARFDHLVALA